VQDCESLKNHDPDGVKLGFLKEFWEKIKDDFVQFFNDFHTSLCAGG